MHGYVPLNRVRGWGISCLKQIEQRNEQFYKALVAYSFINPVNCHFLCIFTLYINTLDNHLFSFFSSCSCTVWSSHILPEWRNKKIGGDWISIRFDMWIRHESVVNNRNYYHSDNSCYNIMLSMNMLVQYKQHAKRQQCPIAQGQWILLLGY